MKRVVFIDIAKAICIVLVVVGHVDSHSFPQWYRTIILGIYTFHMPLFMFASGYLYSLTKKEEPYLVFLRKKFRRLMIPYFVCSFFIISLKLFLDYCFDVKTTMSASSYFFVFFKPEAGYFLWFIWSLWLIFIIVPFFKSKRQRLILFLFSVIVHYFAKEFTDVFSLTPTKYMFMYFMAGVVLHDFRNVGQLFKKIPFCAYFSLFVVAEYLLFTYPEFLWLKLIIGYIGIAFIISLSFIIEKNNRTRINNIFVSLSVSSFFIYLFHTTFEGFAKAILSCLSVTYNPAIPISLFVIVSFTVCVGLFVPIYLYFHLIVKLKITRLLFGVR